MRSSLAFSSRACTSRRVAFSDFSDSMVCICAARAAFKMLDGSMGEEAGVDGCDADLLMSAVNFSPVP